MRLDYSIILDWVHEDSGVLDLGCGDGELLLSLVKEKRAKAHGIEIDEQAIYKCVEKGLSVSHEDIESGLAAYPDESFEYVIMNGSLQEVKKPDSVFKEALRVGKNLIVGFPNFAHYRSRVQILLRGKVPLTPVLPYQWYDTPNLHFLSVSDFEDYCKLRGLAIRASAFVAKEKRVRFLPNLRAEYALFLSSKEGGSPRTDGPAPAR
jgi:methionine biosynthesis protein MetW